MGNTRTIDEQIHRAVRGAIAHNHRDVTGTYTVQLTDVVLYVNSGSGGFTITLPPAPQMAHRFLYVIKKGSDTNTITVAGNGYNINGSGTLGLSITYAWAILYSSGAEWRALT